MRTFLLVLTLASMALAKPYMPDTVDVPTDKLLTRMEKKAAAAPKDARLQYLLARVHAIAYAQNQTQFAVGRQTPDEPFFGPFDPGYPPSAVQPKPGAKKHLKLALEHYRKAVELDPKSNIYRLGLAWTLEESGQKKQAIEQYRKVYRDADLKDDSPNFGKSICEEAGGRLLELLDPKKDAAEIAQIKATIARLEKIPRAVTPVLVPLDRKTPFERLVNSDARVRFDLDGSGRRRAWGWTTPEAGWLIYHDGASSGLRMFGSVTWWVFWRDGYEAMSSLDLDEDGWLTGSELDDIKVWCDRNQDGVCDKREVLTLDELDIVGLRCRSEQHPLGFPYSPEGVRYRDGQLGPSYDWMPEGRL